MFMVIALIFNVISAFYSRVSKIAKVELWQHYFHCWSFFFNCCTGISAGWFAGYGFFFFFVVCAFSRFTCVWCHNHSEVTSVLPGVIEGFLVVCCDAGCFEVACDIESLGSCSVCRSEGEDDRSRLSIVKGVGR